MKKLLIIFCLCTTLYSNAQLTWDRTYSSHCANSIVQTYNNEYVYGGAKYYSMLQEWNITRLNPSGDIIHDSTFCHGNDGRVCCINNTSDSGYIVLGQDTSVWVLRYDKNDHLLWNKYLLTSLAEPMDLVSINNGHIIVGRYYTANMIYDLFIIRINDQGDTVWTKRFNNGPFAEGTAIIQAYDSGYICICNKENGSWLYKINEQGDSLWTKRISFYDFDRGTTICKTNDSCYIIGGNNSGCLFFTKADKDGNVIWTKLYIDPDHFFNEFYCHKIIQTFNNGYIAACEGLVYHIHYTDTYARIIRLDSNGDSTRYLRPSFPSGAEDIISTTDSMFVFSGYKVGKAWVVKSDSIFDFTVGLPEKTEKVKFENYPNPFSTYTTFRFNDRTSIEGTLRIYDMLGNLIFTTKLRNQNNYEYFPDNLNSGVYFYEIFIKNNLYRGKMIKQ
jgi:hypothetical protein